MFTKCVFLIPSLKYLEVVFTIVAKLFFINCLYYIITISLRMNWTFNLKLEMCELLVSCSSTCGLIEIIFVSLTYSDVNKFYVKYIFLLNVWQLEFLFMINVCLTYVELDMIQKLELLWYWCYNFPTTCTQPMASKQSDPIIEGLKEEINFLKKSSQ